MQTPNRWPKELEWIADSLEPYTAPLSFHLFQPDRGPPMTRAATSPVPSFGGEFELDDSQLELLMDVASLQPPSYFLIKLPGYESPSRAVFRIDVKTKQMTPYIIEKRINDDVSLTRVRVDLAKI